MEWPRIYPQHTSLIKDHHDLSKVSFNRGPHNGEEFIMRIPEQWISFPEGHNSPAAYVDTLDPQRLAFLMPELAVAQRYSQLLPDQGGHIVAAVGYQYIELGKSFNIDYFYPNLKNFVHLDSFHEDPVWPAENLSLFVEQISHAIDLFRFDMHLSHRDLLKAGHTSNIIFLEDAQGNHKRGFHIIDFDLTRPYGWDLENCSKVSQRDDFLGFFLQLRRFKNVAVNGLVDAFEVQYNDFIARHGYNPDALGKMPRLSELAEDILRGL